MFDLPLFLVQIIVILIAARTVGWLFQKFHQPQVVGEMLAGVMLGPSLLGWLSPDISRYVFPAPSLVFVNALSQIGMILFMFLVGLELDPKRIASQRRTALVISHVSILIPFVLGALVALLLYPRLSDASVPFTQFALFMGVSMSVTAFPVLARILTERKILDTEVGSLAISCAAVDDITAWCILAGVVLLARSSAQVMPIWFMLLGTLAFISVMWLGARRLLVRIEQRFILQNRMSQGLLGFILLLVFLSAWVTETLGIHALFGAFLLGAIMPKDSRFVHAVKARLEDIAIVLLLPLYFAYTGLQTSVGLINSFEMWSYFAVIMIVAMAGKLGGAAVSAHLAGLPWREATAIGVLMNTRGLVELVVLNIGLEIGVISPALYTMMVMMAIATTLMTTPILDWVYPGTLRQKISHDPTSPQIKVG